MGADTAGAASRGYDVERRSTATERHIVTDNFGLLIVVAVTTAVLQDRDGGRVVLERAKMRVPSIVGVWADGGYAVRAGRRRPVLPVVLVEIVRKPPGQRACEVLPRRWVLERTLSWLMRIRRLAGDDERLPEHSGACVQWSMIGLMTRRLAPASGRRPRQPNTTA